MGGNVKRKRSVWCSYKSVCDSITPYSNQIIFITICSLQSSF